MFLHELILFLFFFLKASIIVIALLILMSGIMALAFKSKLKNKEKIKVKPLNTHYEALEMLMSAAILSKDELKQKEKKLKAKTKKEKKAKKTEEKSKRIFVIHFVGDMKASKVQSLREEITAILEVANTHDTVFVKLESAGGLVHAYGLAASELLRIKDRGIHLIVSVDKVAASGGYMMACIAHQIIAAPFAIIGSIGVVAQLPNFHQVLKKHHIDYEQITAGEYKRTLTLFGENTEQGRQKVQEEVDDTHELFKEFIQQHRPQVDLTSVATGEHWFALRAKNFNLVDQLMTSDEYLAYARKDAKLFEVTYGRPKKLTEQFSEKLQGCITKILEAAQKPSSNKLLL